MVSNQQSTAVAYANLAFIKYWGKADATLNLPLNNSISMNLSAAKTTTTVTFDATLKQDIVTIDGQPSQSNFSQRVSQQLDRVRLLAKQPQLYALVDTHNAFPMGAGFASSASGMAALSLAATSALTLQLTKVELSALARRGSGSACRSIPAGFVEWLAGDNDTNSHAIQLAPPNHWDIADVAVVVSQAEKKVSSTLGHKLVEQSHFLQTRLAHLPNRLDRLRQALLDQDFETFGQETEAEAITLHALAMTSPHQTGTAWQSGIYYWTPDTLELLLAVQSWRADGLPVYFTLDAGPTVHLLCPADKVTAITEAVTMIARQQPNRHWDMLVSYPAIGAHLID